MAIQASLNFKGVQIKDAYIVIAGIAGGKTQGNWYGQVSVFATAALSKLQRIVTKAAVPAVPAVPEIPATDEDMAIPGSPEVPEQPAEFKDIEPDPIFQFQVAAKFDPDSLNPYTLLYAAIKTAPELAEVEDV